MFDSPIQEIKDKLPITEVLADYIQMRKAGTNYKAVCPFHNEKSASLMISPSKQIWHCFGCGLGGDIFEFIKLSENVDFPEALKILADRAGVELKKLTVQEIQVADKKNVLYEINAQAAKYFEKVLWESKAGSEALEYLKKRGLTDQTIKKWQLGFAPDDFHYLEKFLSKSYSQSDIEQAGLAIKKDDGSFYDRFRGRVMFPIHNLHGQVVGFTGRVLKEQENVGKYVNSPETPIYNKSREIYGLFFAKNQIRQENRAVLVEGNMDVISSHQAGFNQSVASSGTALTNLQLSVLQRFSENLIFAFDTDNAGANATKRALEEALNLGFNVKIVNMQGTKDPDELIKKGVGLWKKAVETASNYVEFYFDRVLKSEVATVESKREVVKELGPLIVRMTDTVTKAHFIRKLANGINVAESAIWDIISRLTAPKPTQPKKGLDKRKNRREVLEDLLLGLVINLKDKTYLDDFTQTEFTGINQELFDLIKTNQSFDADQLKKKNPKLATAIELLEFASELDVNGDTVDANQEIGRVKSELKKLIIKEEMQKISESMIQAEHTKNKELMSALSKKFTELSQQIQNYQ